MANLIVTLVFINTVITAWFSRDTDLYCIADVTMAVLCCLLPIVPFGYAYRWCNKFVRGEI